tara:strand:- start:21040 stop:21744 length:705 start_codon:yes stop_codon:yes gene_type:complete
MSIPIFIGYDYRERAATNVLIDSLYQNSSVPISITPLITSQLVKKGFYFRKKDPKQSTEFSFTRFLVPHLMNYKGWAIFMDCDMLCFEDINKLWEKRDDKYAVMCVKHEHIPSEKTKFQGEIQSQYPKKNWSSLMLFNCEKCKKLTINYVNSATGLELHRFFWLSSEDKIGELDKSWNFLIGVSDNNDYYENTENLSLVHWTLGGPWFKEQRFMGGRLAANWFASRDNSMKLWD